MRAPANYFGKSSWCTGDIYVRSAARRRLRAWEPYGFALELLFAFQHTDLDDEHPEWRIYWFSGVVALRTIGHVLHKVDAKSGADRAATIDRFWKRINTDKDENWIFFDFIEKERNNVLKEFSFGAELPTSEDGRALAYNGTHLDGAELFREALYWWRAQLEALERELA